jgi:hypothetical protein
MKKLLIIFSFLVIFLYSCVEVSTSNSVEIKNGEDAELYLKTLLSLYKNIPVFLIIPKHSRLEGKEEIVHKDLLYDNEKKRKQSMNLQKTE